MELLVARQGLFRHWCQYLDFILTVCRVYSIFNWITLVDGQSINVNAAGTPRSANFPRPFRPQIIFDAGKYSTLPVAASVHLNSVIMVSSLSLLALCRNCVIVLRNGIAQVAIPLALEGLRERCRISGVATIRYLNLQAN
jgi:hypothetical protein